MRMYIRSAACISAQKTFNNDAFLTDIVEYTGTRLKVIEPDYSQFIDAKAARRMSRVIKMGVASAQKCLWDANVTMPGAIITGTAFGCMEDTVTFLTRIVEMNEEMLPPTAFIQSTHNTVAAQIALTLKCHNYNNTFVHKGISFESALFDAIMLLNEREADDVLVGCTEEMVDTSFKVLTRLGLYKSKPVSNLQLYETPSKGTIGGEGAAFFLLGSQASENNLAELKGVKTLFGEYGCDEISAGIIEFLAGHQLALNNIDLVITGRNGDTGYDRIYDDLKNSLFKDTPTTSYKHLCGEYPVSTSFALWMAANIIIKGVVPDVVKDSGNITKDPKAILIYNHYQYKYHSLMLLTAC